MNESELRQIAWAELAAHGSDLLFSGARSVRPARSREDGLAWSLGPSTDATNRWDESAWFKEWEDLAYASLGRG